MKTTSALLFSFAAVMLAYAESTSSTLTERPEIVVDRATSDIFPEKWRTPKVSAKAEPLAMEAQPRGRKIVEKALAKYPTAVLQKNLKKVYVVERLEYSGVTTGGSNSRCDVYVVSNGKYSAKDIEKNVHAEFSSILLRNFLSDFDEAAWLNINPPDFRYRGNGVLAIKNKQASLKSTDALHEEGFMNESAKASVEEDFNSYASRLFMGHAGLWRAIETFPKVKAKADLTIAFYGKLDASFTQEFFLSLRVPE